jgi:DNA-binding beta-propeller fold protein YncE
VGAARAGTDGVGGMLQWQRGSVVGVIVAAFVLGVAAPAVATPGGVVWIRRYTGPDTTGSFDRRDAANKVAVSPDGSKVFVTGTRYGVSTVPRTSGSGNDYATLAYNAATGATLWSAVYNGPGNFIDIATAIAVSPDGTKVFVTGRSSGVTSRFDYATMAYSAATGALLWMVRYNGPGNFDDEAFAIAVSPDGTKVFVTGMSWASRAVPTNGEDYWTIAYRAGTGAVVWNQRYSGPDKSGVVGHGDWASALGVSPDGSKVFITGRGYGSGTASDYETVAYNAATGAVVWIMRYDDPQKLQDMATAIAVSPDGTKVFVTGQSEEDVGSSFIVYDYMTLAYNATTGKTVWGARYSNQRGDSPAAIRASRDGTRVFVTGTSHGQVVDPVGQDYATVAYHASSGIVAWTKRYDGASQPDVASALAISPDSTTVFVTGASTAATGNDYTTIAYSAATGGVLWVRRYNGPGNSADYGNALAVGPGGNSLYVTGTSYGSATSGYDYATVAYRVR